MPECPPFPCPPEPPLPCPQSCAPPPPPVPCHVKPIMRGLHMSQMNRTLTQGLLVTALGGLTFYLMYTRPHMEKYREFYRLAELSDWENDMAEQGHFQAVPQDKD